MIYEKSSRKGVRSIEDTYGTKGSFPIGEKASGKGRPKLPEPSSCRALLMKIHARGMRWGTKTKMKGGRVASARTGRAMLPPTHRRILLNIAIRANQGSEKKRAQMYNAPFVTCKISAPFPEGIVGRDFFPSRILCSYSTVQYEHARPFSRYA